MSVAQLDLFAANQLDLLTAVPVSQSAAPAAVGPTRPCGMPRSVAEMHVRAGSAEVVAAMLEVAKARPGEWLTYAPFESTIKRFNISSCRARPMYQLVQAGELEERRVYFGTREVGPGYKGFGHEWRYTPKAAANA